METVTDSELTVVRVADSSPGLRRRIVDSTTPALHSSSLVGDSRLPRHLGGSLCPNPRLRDGRLLDDVLGTGFAPITTVRPTAADEASMRRRGAVVLFPQPRDALATWLRRGHASAAVVCAPTGPSPGPDVTSRLYAPGQPEYCVSGERVRRIAVEPR